MSAILSLAKTLDEQSDSLLDEVNDAAILNAARQLIARHRAGHSFDIDALDVPHRALFSIAEKLEYSGAGHALSRPLIEALRRYVMESGGAFARAVNAKPVLVRMTVAPEMPSCRFKNGMTELACLGASEVKVEGSSSINVRATPTGTATTSNAANVDAMFANIKGLHLWIRFESPTREDMDALLSSMDVALAGIAQSIGGAMSAEDFKKLIEQLEQEGSLAPAVLALITKVIALQDRIKAGSLSADSLQEMLGEIGVLMKDIQSNNLAPAALIQAVMTSMADLPSNQAILSFLTEQGFQGTLADNDNIPAEVIEALKMGKELMALLEDIALQIQNREVSLEDLPPELANLIEAMGGIESLLDPESRGAHVQSLTEAFTNDEKDPLAEAVHAAVIALAAPEVIASLSLSLVARVQEFVQDHPAIMEMAVGATIMWNLKDVLQTMDVTSPEAIEFQKTIQLIKQDGFSVLLTDKVQASLPDHAVSIIRQFSNEHIEAVEIAATHAFLESLQDKIKGLNADTPEQAELLVLIDQINEKGLTDFWEAEPFISPAAFGILQAATDIKDATPPEVTGLDPKEPPVLLHTPEKDKTPAPPQPDKPDEQMPQPQADGSPNPEPKSIATPQDILKDKSCCLTSDDVPERLDEKAKDNILSRLQTANELNDSKNDGWKFDPDREVFSYKDPEGKRVEVAYEAFRQSTLDNETARDDLTKLKQRVFGGDPIIPPKPDDQSTIKPSFDKAGEPAAADDWDDWDTDGPTIDYSSLTPKL